MSIDHRHGAALLTAVVGLLAACGGGDPPATVAAAAATPPRQALSATAPAPSSSVTALMDWAEHQYPQHFPAHADDGWADPYHYRHYAQTGNHIGVAGDAVYVLGPVVDNRLVQLGRISDFIQPDVQDPPPDCPTAGVDAVWARARLGCATPGQRVAEAFTVNHAPGDSVYTVRQVVLGSNGLNVLDPRSYGKGRNHIGMVCFRNQSASSSLGLDPTAAVLKALALENPIATANPRFPSGVMANAIQVIDGRETTCNALQHPLIINRRSGLVDAVNRAALARVTVTDTD